LLANLLGSGKTSAQQVVQLVDRALVLPDPKKFVGDVAQQICQLVRIVEFGYTVMHVLIPQVGFSSLPENPRRRLKSTFDMRIKNAKKNSTCMICKELMNFGKLLNNPVEPATCSNII
jgi:hypothetical protein